jgi:hypothetical protein
MRSCLAAFALVLMVSAANAQSSFVRDGSIGTVKADSQHDGPLATVEVGDWVGLKFLFMPQAKAFRRFGYGNGPTKLPYEQWVGKVVTVTKVVSGIIPEVTFKADIGKPFPIQVYSGSVEGLAPVRDLEYARSQFTGKTLWLRSTFLQTWDEATEKSGGVDLTQYSPVHVEDVVAGKSVQAPVRLILKAPGGEIGYRDVNLSGTNIAKILREFDHFADLFYETDPRLTHVWPREVWDAIEHSSVFIGMTDEQATMSWGKPNSINMTVTARGNEEQWVYARGRYLYMSNGRVTTMQM